MASKPARKAVENPENLHEHIQELLKHHAENA